MKTLLYLVHRIPYPPNKGDKIRSYQLLKYLSGRYRVLLGAFVDYADDWRHRGELEALCGEVYLRPIRPLLARARSLSGLLDGRPLTIPYYRDRRMGRWARNKIAQGVDAILVFSSSMAQYVESSQGRNIARMIDFVDLDSEKWRQYSASRGGVARAIYGREGRLLADYENETARRFTHSLLVTDAEAATLVRRCPELAAQVHAVPNGVDHRFFDPSLDMRSPYEAGAEVVVFTGAMDYWANVDAVTWFAKEAWPRIAAARPGARFYVVGSRPARAVQDLGRLAGVHVTGTVDDIRPYLKFAAVAVAPMRLGRGVQNKVLEALAMGLPVVGTPAAVVGLSKQAAASVTVADDDVQLAAATLAELGASARDAAAQRNRRVILEDYDWERNLSAVVELLNAATVASAGGAR